MHLRFVCAKPVAVRLAAWEWAKVLIEFRGYQQGQLIERDCSHSYRQAETLDLIDETVA